MRSSSDAEAPSETHHPPALVGDGHRRPAIRLADRLHHGHPLPALFLRSDCPNLSLLRHYSDTRRTDASGIREPSRLVLPPLRIGVVGRAPTLVRGEPGL